MGLRNETIKKIEKLTETTEYSRRDAELSTKTVHEIYVEVTGNAVDYKKDKAWHVRKILDELDIETRSNIYGQNSAVPVKELQELWEKLQQDSSYFSGRRSTQGSNLFSKYLKS